MTGKDTIRAFDEAMLNIYRTAKSECRYNATDFLGMLTRHGGLETARRLLAPTAVQYGFSKLWEYGRLDLTVECLVLNRRFRDLFTVPELDEARRRLRAHDHDPAGCEV